MTLCSCFDCARGRKPRHGRQWQDPTGRWHWLDELPETDAYEYTEYSNDG